MVNKIMRFINDLPIIESPFPVCGNGTDISISYYLFNKNTSPENPTGEGLSIIDYAYEAAYAYRQLLKHTNIQECGRVRFFMDRRCEDQMRPYFEKIGLDSLITLIDVPFGVRLSGYLPCFSHEDVADCRYRFHSDSDLWWMSDDSGTIFDWRQFCASLDETDDECFYGQPIQKPDWVYQVNFSQHAMPDEVQTKAKATLERIFGPRIPDIFHKIANEDHNNLKIQNEPAPFKCFGGWFVGVRKDSVAAWHIQKLYQTEGDILGDDEGFYALLFYLSPHLKQHKVLQGEGDLLPNEIPHAALGNFKSLEGVGVINIGTQPFYDPTCDAERNELAAYFRNVDREKKIIVSSGPLKSFGRHIIGTEALDAGGYTYHLTSYAERGHGPLLGFPAAFPPIQSHLPSATRLDSDIVVFFCLSYHPFYFSHDLHVYAKSMIYAYKMLTKHTNILDVGRVYFFIDSRCMPVVMPYCRRSGLTDLVIPFNSDKNVHYAAYIPCFWHEEMRDAKYRLYMDVDMWWINLHNKPVFDYQNMVSELDTKAEDIIGNTVPKTMDGYYADLYKRCHHEGDTHIEKLKRHYGDTLPKSDFRGITGCHNGVRGGTETLERLKSLYDEMGDLIRDDEGFWATFLTKNPDIEITLLHEHIGGVGFDYENVEHHQGPEVAHVGTYMFEHFFKSPYAETFYNHCLEN